MRSVYNRRLLTHDFFFQKPVFVPFSPTDPENDKNPNLAPSFLPLKNFEFRQDLALKMAIAAINDPQQRIEVSIFHP